MASCLSVSLIRLKWSKVEEQATDMRAVALRSRGSLQPLVEQRPVWQSGQMSAARACRLGRSRLSSRRRVTFSSSVRR